MTHLFCQGLSHLNGMSELILPEDRAPLDIYKSYLDYQLSQALAFYSGCVGLLRSLKLVEWLRPPTVEFVDSGNYDRCGTWDTKACSCSTRGTSTQSHPEGKPVSIDIALKLPVSTFKEWVYNRCRLYCWKWSVRIMTDASFLEESRKRPEVYYDMFVYPVNTNYLTPATTQAALLRWLKLSCPKINYNIALIAQDASCLPRRTP